MPHVETATLLGAARMLAVELHDERRHFSANMIDDLANALEGDARRADQNIARAEAAEKRGDELEDELEAAVKRAEVAETRSGALRQALVRLGSVSNAIAMTQPAAGSETQAEADRWSEFYEAVHEAADVCEVSATDFLTPRANASSAKTKIEAMRDAVVRFVNAQGRHLSDSWKEHFLEAFDLMIVPDVPHQPVAKKPHEGSASPQETSPVEIEPRLVVGGPAHVQLWKAINEYAESGTAIYGNTWRQSAVVLVERAISAGLQEHESGLRKKLLAIKEAVEAIWPSDHAPDSGLLPKELQLRDLVRNLHR